MICSKCGAELPEGSVVCPKCGQEVQIITAVDVLEEEMLRAELVEGEDSESPDRTAVQNSSSAAKKAKKKKQKRNRRILTVILLAAAAVVILGVVFFRMNHSTERMLRLARQDYVERDYEGALGCLDKLFALDEDNEEGLILAGDVYAALEDYANAENAYLRAIALYPDSVEAYEGILEVYYTQGKMDEILALRRTVTDETILALFDAYVIPSPEIKAEGGIYDDYPTVEIRAPKKGLTVYYTLDGTIPTNLSELYVSPIEIQEEGTVVLTAICMDENGFYSEPVSETYEIEPQAAVMPMVYPDGGEFSYQAEVTVTVPPGSTVYYTWDNTDPGTDSYRYTGPITIPEGNNVLSLVAIYTNGKRSEVLRCNYIYYPETTSQTIETYSGGSSETEPTESVEEEAIPIDEPEPAEETEPEEQENPDEGGTSKGDTGTEENGKQDLTNQEDGN